MVVTAHQHGAGDSGGFKLLDPPSENRRKADKRSVSVGKTTTARQAA
jgi:hypothetical protein